MEEYIAMEKIQGNVCKICEKPNINGRRLSIDHDHACCSGTYSCGKCIRGLICFNCNTALGNVNDNIELLQKMIKYLQK